MKKIKGQKDLVNYSANMAKEFGSVVRAILYSQIIYWWDIKKRSSFYKTDKDWEQELGLGLSEVRQAKKRLTEQGFITTVYKRLDHTTEYIVDEENLNSLIYKLYGEHYQDLEHSQNLHSGMKNLTMANEKSDTRQCKNLHSLMQNLTLDIGTEITTEITTESVERIETPQPPQFDKIEFISKMRNAEKRGNFYLTIWNATTGRKDFMTEEIKKQIFNFSDLGHEDLEARIEKFEIIKKLILSKKMEKYFFSKIWERNFQQFLTKFNDFGGNDEEIISKLAMFGEEKKALRILATDVEETVAPIEKKQTEEEKQANRAILEQQRKKLLARLSKK